MLTVSVKNFGPIVEGTVDLKPLTIFVGPSNTGKSYMATAVYAVMRAFQGYDLVPPRPRTASRWTGYSREMMLSWRDTWGSPGHDSAVAEAIYEWGRQLELHGKPEAIAVADMPEEVRLELERVTLQALSWFRQEVRELLSQAYREPVSRINNPESFLIIIQRDEPLLNIVFSSENDEKAITEFDISQTEIVPSPLVLSEFSNILREGWEPVLVPEVFDAWLESATRALADGVPDRSFYLPAARSGIVQGHKILSAELVRQSPLRRGQQAYFPTLPGITTEFLGNLISLDQRMRSQRLNLELENAISFIENNVLCGRIFLDESSGLPYPEIAYETDVGEFTLDQTSSMVSELAPLVLFLKYLIRPGDLLIFEEPESHLHPAAQRQLARGIVRLVNAGVKVLITTHSDIFVSQINNLLALGQASPELVAEGGFVAEDFLRKDQVGAYLFRYSHELGGSEIVPLEIDPDTGIDEDEFAEVFEAIYDESIALQRDRN